MASASVASRMSDFCLARGLDVDFSTLAAIAMVPFSTRCSRENPRERHEDVHDLLQQRQTTPRSWDREGLHGDVQLVEGG